MSERASAAERPSEASSAERANESAVRANGQANGPEHTSRFFADQTTVQPSEGEKDDFYRI